MQVRAAYRATIHAYENLTGCGLRPLHIAEFEWIRFDRSWMLKQAGFHSVASNSERTSEFTHTFSFPSDYNFPSQPVRFLCHTKNGWPKSQSKTLLLDNFQTFG